MPRKKSSDIGRNTRQSRRMTNRRMEIRTEASDEENQVPTNIERARYERSRSRISGEQSNEDNRLHRLALRHELEIRRAVMARTKLRYIGFHYNSTDDYSVHRLVLIGGMNNICQYCGAVKFKNETPGLCCLSGKIVLPPLNAPIGVLRALLSGTTAESRHFLEKIQTYNSLFQMTSFGATNIIRDNFMPTFKIQGQIYHRVGTLLPNPNNDYSFLQIYFIGNSDAQVNRRCEISSNLRRSIVDNLQSFLHEENELVKLFKVALERMPTDNHKIVIRADKVPVGQHAGRFNAPTIDEVAIVIVGEAFNSRDIVLHRRNANNSLERISETHRCYDALQYPLLFWQGEDGYHFNIKMRTAGGGAETNKNVSSMNFYAYRFMFRENDFNHILKCRKLFHQFAVDMYAKVESERLNFLRYHQKELRCDEYIHLRDEVRNNGDVRDIGEVTILPATYTGSPRHLHEYAQDAMTYVRNYQRPDLFITFTCNPQWDEVKQNLFPYQLPVDRHDITARVFKQKLKSLMDFIVKHEIYGEVRCWMYSVEWQKRGLPHAHILIWLKNKITPDEIDNVICAEIPDKNTDPILFDVVIKNMIHGPCGLINPNSPCMVDGKCSKRYPRDLVTDTITGLDGYPLYRRRSTENNGKSTIIRVRNQDIVVDNRWVVPYSPLLSKTFKAHINVEYCNSVKSIKYICKYVNKGSDMAVFGVANVNRNDEITQYQLARYISTNEALWRIFSFPIHERYPAVVHLAVHLENGQRVYFTPENAMARAISAPATTLTEFFKLCQNDSFARTLLYSDVPKYYTWQANKTFQRRKRGAAVHGFLNVFSSDTIGRIYTIHPSNAECFYLRLLLVNVHGPQSFEHLRTVDGELCSTYREACLKLKLLEDDSHWDTTLAEASIIASPNQIRDLFAIVISTCCPSDPRKLWEKYRNYMTEDILHQFRRVSLNDNLEFTELMYNEVLIKIEDICLMIANRTLQQCGMIAPDRSMQDAFDQELNRERQYDLNELRNYVQDNVPKMNELQRRTYDSIMQAIQSGNGGFYFLDAPGGTGKTFLISLILAEIRSKGKLALALASSGIAATLLDGGRTAHSALKLPLNVNSIEAPTCKISKRSGMAKVLQQCEIIFWDECTMAHKKSLEALDRTMKDLRGNQNLFGGALVLLSGDFRQTLPIIPRSTAADEINACLKSSNLWRYVKKLHLTTNVRVYLQNDPTAAEFSKQLLAIGNGTMPVENLTGMITFPQNFCNFTQSKEELMKSVFPNIASNYLNHDWLSDRAILAGTNKEVTELNWSIQSEIPGELVSFKSIDSIVDEDDVVNYPTEFLNSIDLSGLPPHNLRLKIGVPIILLRNISQPKLCNGTRLAVKRLNSSIIEARILKGKYKGEDVLIPRIPMIPPDLPFNFKRLQYPIRLAFAMTINKAQGQSMQIGGINLENPVFSHGQLYVACSRVGKPSSLFIYAKEGKTKNVVYVKALE